MDQLEPLHPEAAFTVARDFNKDNMKKTLLKYHQHVEFHTQGTTFWTMFTLLTSPSPAFSKSDHSSTLLLPSHRQSRSVSSQ